ncbi:MAG TPA: dihydrolipoamide acetyltransferase family protein, partial [Nitrospirales bacterium]|nr:dihydrolipoamide acetyltransferase family protein [Nitrospirales bacterium]
KAEGDHVESGDVLAEIETDKAVMDLEAFASGTLRKILVPEGTTVPSGTLIGVIGEPDEDIKELVKEQPVSASPTTKPVTPSLSQEKAEGEAVPSPRVRTLARERGLDLTNIKGSGPGGRIVERDLEPLLAKKDQPAAREIPLTQMRKAIVRATTQSKAPVPHFYVTTEVDMGEGVRFVEESKKQGSQSPVSLTHLIIAAAARALVQHPGLNAAFAGETIRVFPSIDIGIAVALEDGLIVPVLRDCGKKPLRQIAEAERALVTRARNRELTPEEYTGATFSISNLGMFDVENFIAVILPPAAAVLAVGSVREIPVVKNRRVEIGSRLKLTLSCDHRVVDGAAAAKFLQTFKRGLEHPGDL